MKGEPSISGKKIVAKSFIKARGIWGREVFQDGLFRVIFKYGFLLRRVKKPQG